MTTACAPDDRGLPWLQRVLPMAEDYQGYTAHRIYVKIVLLPFFG